MGLLYLKLEQEKQNQRWDTKPCHSYRLIAFLLSYHLFISGMIKYSIYSFPIMVSALFFFITNFIVGSKISKISHNNVLLERTCTFVQMTGEMYKK